MLWREVYGRAALPDLACDLCGEEIVETEPIIALTEWDPRAPEPAEWENSYLVRIDKAEWTRIADRVSRVQERLRAAAGASSGTAAGGRGSPWGGPR